MDVLLSGLYAFDLVVAVSHTALQSSSSSRSTTKHNDFNVRLVCSFARRRYRYGHHTHAIDTFQLIRALVRAPAVAYLNVYAVSRVCHTLKYNVNVSIKNLQHKFDRTRMSDCKN